MKARRRWLAAWATLFVVSRARADATTQTCEPQWTERVYRDARAAVVRIETSNGDAEGAGFFFRRNDRVATALHVVDSGPIVVILANGERHPGSIVARDPDHDLAILALDRAVDSVTPLLPSSSPPRVGEPVLAIGHPYSLYVPPDYKGLLDWSASAGIVSGANDHYVQSDAKIDPGNSGGPLLDCSGEVVGIADRHYYDLYMFVRVSHLVALAERKEEAPSEPGGAGLRFGGAFGVFVDSDPTRTWGGVRLASSFTIAQRWKTSLDLSFAYWSGDADGAVLAQSGKRTGLSLFETFAIPLTPSHGLWLQPGLGVGVLADSISRVTADVTPNDPACTTNCPSHVTAASNTDSMRSFRVFPLLALTGGGLWLSAQWMFEPAHPSVRTLRVSLGVLW